MRVLSGLCVLAAMILLTSLSAVAQDSIFNAKGVPTRGIITKTSPTEVTLEIGGAGRPFPVNEIRKVSFANEPAELDKAREAVRALNWNSALEELRKIKDEPDREIVKQDIEYYRALCTAKSAMEGNSDKKVAAGMLKAFIDKNEGSFHFFEANEVFGDLATAAGQSEAAAKYYAALSKAPWPDYKMRAAVYEARALLASKSYPEALAKFETILGSGVNTPEALAQKQRATIGKAVCLAHTGKEAEGLKLLEDIVANNDPSSDPVLFGRVYNALGACHLKLGKNRDALMDYLAVHLLFNNDADSHAEALNHLVKLWTEVGQNQRSLAARKMLNERYPGSPWAIQ